MEQLFTFGIVGLSTAAIYAIIGSGLVLTYTTTGVFNFAHGAAGMMAAFVYWQLTEGWGLPVPIALVLVLAVLAPGFGLLVERVVLRPVQGLGEAERLVMTVAMLSGLIAVARWIWDPNEARSLPTFFADQGAIDIGPATITWHQALTMIVAVAVAVGLRVLLYGTRIGAEMRASVDDRALVGLTGANPVRSNQVAWILGTQLAAIGGILIAPSVSLDAGQLSLLIVSAYTAAIFGRLRSLPLTFLGAVVVGCLESYLTGYLPSNDYLPGLRLAAPALLLFLALLVFPHRRLRGRDTKARPVAVPSIRGTLVFAGVIVVFGVVLASVLGEGDLITYGTIFSFGVIALSYVPLAGYAGQISLCQLSMAGIGAAVWAHMGADGGIWALAATVVISGAAGALVALPALRLSGVYLALGTAAFAVILDRWIFTLPAFDLFGAKISLYDGGTVDVSGPSLFGWHLDSGSELMVFSAVWLALTTLAVAWLRRGRFGRQLIALRDSEAAYATLGGNLLRSKVAVFAMSAGIAGLGGALYGMQQRSVTAEQFGLVAGLPLFLIAVIGGLTSVGNGLFSGAALGGSFPVISAAGTFAQNITSVLPGLAGLGLARNPDGAVPEMRAGAEPLGRNKPVLAGLIGVLVVLWVLQLGDVLDGWLTFSLALVLIVAAQTYAQVREAKPVESDVPVEWWGVRRAWRREDEEVLARGIAGG
ncbi:MULTISPECIES: ABC transporter permease [unclassified Parafrankia]|uniref:branched-chain amino acid ABC transporter permease n=1 Tax=unclassified Parafrankia TaxID=2994368 RepID=UPI000DA58AD1|nr:MULTISPECIES: ABC transporter permease [unclassified Parafrankia]TCJ33684.1 ABC transporter permease [Parafrankia sp. BMG5.11]CAI7980621.1 branched-chain amino acid transport system permease protein [Frankia sp. Hr75.2]SQD99041.1 Inner-membrane translocator [Parafrankia sp. Ea1.12]